MNQPLPLPVAGADDPFWALWESYDRHLHAEGRSPRTRQAYSRIARQFHRYLIDHLAPVDPTELQRQHIEEFLIHLRDQRQQKPATIHLAHASLHGFFGWLVAEGDLEATPMARLKAPKVDEPAPSVLTDAVIEALLKTCAQPPSAPYDLFLNRRDAALIRFLLDTGLRRVEALHVRLEDLDLREQMVRVVRKGARDGVAFYGARTARDLDRYLRVRARQSAAASPFLWLPGSRGGQFLGDDGLRNMLIRRARLAGLEKSTRVNPHSFRHAFADRLKAGGASDEDVMTAGGWRDPKIMRRYAAARSVDRARDMHRRLSPGDRL